MRIIAGTARGTQLFAPKGMETRPTRDQVKESLFNILQSELSGATVLDLFAGSGALALEALSRGAAAAALVDQDREAVQCISRNVEKLRFGDRTTVLHCDWQQGVSRLSADGKQFDLVFLDPPYRMKELADICLSMETRRLLLPDAMLVLEHISGFTPALPPTFELVKERDYRDTVIHFFRWKGEGTR
ncbi:MAG: 16S rRNA (guanine(966)-N(2))-methyltransferase RsmD [Eubacteriales bacterium]|nr:16S rRNA (guanine(966)-N(2))-methyltransferase RsmD [Eubacteriales bacterium]